MKYAWINDHRRELPVADIRRVLKVSRSGFYDSQKRSLSLRAQRVQRMREAVAQVHRETDWIELKTQQRQRRWEF